VTKWASHPSDLRVVTVPHLEVSGHVDKESDCESYVYWTVHHLDR